MFTFLKELSIKRLFLLVFFGINTLLSAQTNDSNGIVLKTDKEILASNEALVAIIASLKNNSDQDFVGTLDVNTDRYLKRVNQGPIAIRLAPGESSFLPIKLWVEKQHTTGSSRVKFSVLDLQNKTVQVSYSVINVAPKRQVRILAKDTQLMMRQIGDSIRVGAQIFNNGNQKEVIKLTASFPQLLYQNTLLNKEVILEPFSDTLVFFSKIIDKELMSQEYFTVNVAALDQNNDFIGNIITTVQNAAGDRRFINPNNNGYSNNYWNNNRVTLSARDIAGINPSYSILAKNEIQIDQSKLAFSIDGTRWEQASLDPLFTNTWVQFENKGKGVQLGNLQENDLEINLSGRGIKVYTTDENREKKLELGFLEKSYNLIGPSAWDIQGIAAFGKNTFQLSEKTFLNSSFIFDRNYNIDSYLLMNNLIWSPNERWKYDFRLGHGLAGANLKNYKIPYKPSIAIGANMEGRLGHYQINSNNFYSSGYYPGIRKGALLFDQRFSRNFENSMAWLGINYYNYNPDFLDPFINYKNDSENLRAEVGMNFILSPHFRLNIVPQINFENGRYLTLNTASYQDMHYESGVINETVNWNSKNHQHNVLLSLNQGVAQYPFSKENHFIHKTQLSWSFQGIQLTGLFQQGNFILVEGLYNSFETDEKLERISIMPSYRRAFWNDRLTVQLNGMYNYDSFSGKSYMIAGTTEWKAFKKTSVFVSVNQYHYQSKAFQTHNTFIQAGITQNLPNSSISTTAKKGTIRVFCFYDRNANGIFDEGDDVAPDRTVMINQSSFVTQKDGTVRYRGVPYGPYKISLKGKNWMAKEYNENLVSKSLELSVPLQETGNIRGKFEYLYDAKLQYEVSGIRSGLTVVLKNQQGQIFTFKTNDQGEYLAHLPIGQYEMQIDPNQLPKNVYTDEPARMITISKGKSQILEPFILKVRERKIEIKHFGS